MPEVTAPLPDFGSLPKFLVGRPFGLDAQGKPIRGVNGSAIYQNLDYLLQCVAERTTPKLVPTLTAAQREQALADARQQALQTLADRCNTMIAEKIYQVTPEYLLNQGHNYSFEFGLILGELCRELSGDAQFHFNKGRVVNPSMAFLSSPLSLTQFYNFIPRLISRMSDLEMEVIAVTETDAQIRMCLDKMIEHIPDALRPRYYYVACESLKGGLAYRPRTRYNLPLATVTDLKCVLRGDPCCEWRFTWQTAAQSRSWWQKLFG